MKSNLAKGTLRKRCRIFAHWLDLSNTQWGVFQANGNSSAGLAWVPQSIKIPTTSQVDANNHPLSSFGNDGDFAIVPWVTSNFVFQKGNAPGSITQSWYQVGSQAWGTLYPTRILGSIGSPASFVSGQSVLINSVRVVVNAGTTPGNNACLFSNSVVRVKHINTRTV